MLRSLIASKPVRAASATASVVVLAMLSVGCETKSFLDPAQVGRWEKDPLVVPILDSLNLGTDELDAQFIGARDVRQEDLVDAEQDYTLSPNDSVQVTINDLAGPGTETTKTLRVSASGKLSLPLLPSPVQAGGLTEQQLEKALSDAYKDAGILTNPNITASVVEARGRVYTMLGAVNGAGPYAIYDADFRLLNALATARDVSSPTGVDYIYVVRKLDKTKSAASTSTPATQPATAPGADPLAPRSDAGEIPTIGGETRKSQMLQTGEAPAGSIVVVDGKEMVVTPPTAATAPSVTEAQTAAAAGQTPFTFNAPTEPTDREVIRVPYSKLKAGEMKYNIIVHPGDFIYVGQPSIGEYYIGGNVLASGAYSLSGRKITLKQAVIAARGLNEVAWPSRTDIVRRLPGDKEVFVRVDLDKIFSGQEPDIYLKADDQVNVGTNALAPFLGALRNGFRLTYGFGFLYDKNFNNDNNNNN